MSKAAREHHPAIRLRRWNDPAEVGDGFRLLVCRYRPRGLRKQDETWNAWWKDLGPSCQLHADFYGKTGSPLTWAEYRKRYLEEMRSQGERIRQLADRLRAGETVTLLCSSACTNGDRCHRALLRDLIEAELELQERGPHS